MENTLAKDIMNSPKEVITLEGRRQALNAEVVYVSFSAHVDFMQNRDFIQKVNPKHIILVHGQKDQMGQLKNALMMQHRRLPEHKRPTVTMPPNTQEVKLKFSRRRSAKVMGSLADKDGETSDGNTKDATNTNTNNIKNNNNNIVRVKEGESIQGILVTQNFNSKILAPEDLKTYTPLRLGSVKSKLHVPFSGSIECLRLFLNEMYSGVVERLLDGEGDSDGVDGVVTIGNDGGSGSGSPMEMDGANVTDEEENNKDEEQDQDNKSKTTSNKTTTNSNKIVPTTFSLHKDQIILTTGMKDTPGIATIEWKASPVNDIMADSVIALLMHAQSSAASIRITSKPCNHGTNGSGRRSRGDDDNDNDNKGEDNDDNENDTTTNKKPKTKINVESMLRMFHSTLLEQFDHDKLEATYEAYKATFEIKTDAGLNSGSLAEGEELTCTVIVEMEIDTGGNDVQAKVSVQCEDAKFGKNIQECLKGVADAAAPVNPVNVFV